MVFNLTRTLLAKVNATALASASATTFARKNIIGRVSAANHLRATRQGIAQDRRLLFSQTYGITKREFAKLKPGDERLQGMKVFGVQPNTRAYDHALREMTSNTAGRTKAQNLIAHDVAPAKASRGTSAGAASASHTAAAVPKRASILSSKEKATLGGIGATALMWGARSSVGGSGTKKTNQPAPGSSGWTPEKRSMAARKAAETRRQ